MIHMRISCKITKLYSNANGIVFDSKSVSTDSSLFQPINLPPKNAKIIKDELTAKSQKVPKALFFYILSNYSNELLYIIVIE